jgi:hypothetical protein
MRRRAILTLGGVLLLLLLGIPSTAVQAGVSIGAYSQEASSETARAGGSISYTHGTNGRQGPQTSSSPGPVTSYEAGGIPTSREASSTSGEVSTSPNVETECVRKQESAVSPCYGVLPAPAGTPLAPATGTRRPVVNPAVLAATVAARLALEPGRIQASPSGRTAGLTGAASWFWLEPAPGTRSLAVALAGERVTVSAAASSVQWGFGDGLSRSAGPGVPYKPGPVSDGAVRHVYQTRCLPGDRGRDPSVLSSCGINGYTIAANVMWAISYQATGPISSSGLLPPRTTTTTIAYPVSESRAFLTARGGGG